MDIPHVPSHMSNVPGSMSHALMPHVLCLECERGERCVCDVPIHMIHAACNMYHVICNKLHVPCTRSQVPCYMSMSYVACTHATCPRHHMFHAFCLRLAPCHMHHATCTMSPVPCNMPHATGIMSHVPCPMTACHMWSRK